MAAPFHCFIDESDSLPSNDACLFLTEDDGSDRNPLVVWPWARWGHVVGRSRERLGLCGFVPFRPPRNAYIDEGEWCPTWHETDGPPLNRSLSMQGSLQAVLDVVRLCACASSWQGS